MHDKFDNIMPAKIHYLRFTLTVKDSGASNWNEINNCNPMET